MKYLFQLMLITIVLAGQAAAERLTSQEMAQLLQDGNRYFQEANQAQADGSTEAQELYLKAAMRFERIVRDGQIENGSLYYNIGNAYFRAGDLGRAILNYRRATRYTPNDPNLLQNLSYARSRLKSRIDDTQQTRMLKTLLFWHYDLSTQTRSVIFAICFCVFWLGASLRLLRPTLAPKALLYISGLAAMLFVSSLLWEHSVSVRNRAGVVVATEVIARKGDGYSYQPSFNDPLYGGTEFKLIENRSKWYEIELRNGQRCWVPAKSVELV